MEFWELHPVNKLAQECIRVGVINWGGTNECSQLSFHIRLASVGTGRSQPLGSTRLSPYQGECGLGNRMGVSRTENEAEQFIQLAAHERVPVQ